MPLVAALSGRDHGFSWMGTRIHSLEADMVPEENVKMLEVVDMCGLGYACPQTLARLGDPWIT